MRLCRSGLLYGFVMVASLSSHAAAQDPNSFELQTKSTPTLGSPDVNVGSALSSDSPPAASELPGPTRAAWGAPVVITAPVPGSVAEPRPLVLDELSRNRSGPMDGFGLADVAVGAFNGALWGLLFSAFSDDVVAGEGASRGALAGVVTVTAIWAVFGPIY